MPTRLALGKNRTKHGPGFAKPTHSERFAGDLKGLMHNRRMPRRTFVRVSISCCSRSMRPGSLAPCMGEPKWFPAGFDGVSSSNLSPSGLCQRGGALPYPKPTSGIAFSSPCGFSSWFWLLLWSFQDAVANEVRFVGIILAARWATNDIACGSAAKGRPIALFPHLLTIGKLGILLARLLARLLAGATGFRRRTCQAVTMTQTAQSPPTGQPSRLTTRRFGCNRVLRAVV